MIVQLLSPLTHTTCTLERHNRNVEKTFRFCKGLMSQISFCWTVHDSKVLEGEIL